MRKSLYLALVLAALSACLPSPPKQPIGHNFYHWKAKPQAWANYTDYLDSLGVQNIYLRFFDWTWAHDQALPVGALQIEPLGPWPRRTYCVPTIYITHQAMSEYPDSLLPQWAAQTAGMIEAKLRLLGSPLCREWQIDCDWSPMNRDKYFRFLEALRQAASFPDLRLSATIRLHQIKYFEQTGVPPVDRGALMFYNMGDLAKTDEPNSILNLRTAKRYVRNFERYPLPLDLALPLFSWGLQFRSGRFIQILGDLQAEELADTTNFEALSPSEYRVKSSHYTEQGLFIYRGDLIRLEQASPEVLLEALELLRPELRPRQEALQIIWYHLSPEIRQRYSARLLQRVVEVMEEGS